MDVEASRAIRQAEAGAAKTMIEPHRGTLRPEARASCGGHGLWIGRDAPLDREREEDRSAHSRHRQVQARGWLIEPGELHVRQGSQCLCVPAGQAPAHDRQDSRWGDCPLSRKDP